MPELKVVPRDVFADDYSPGPCWLNEDPEKAKAITQRRDAFRVVGQLGDERFSPCGRSSPLFDGRTER